MARFTPRLLPDALSADIRFRYFPEGGRWITILIFLAPGKPNVKIRPQKTDPNRPHCKAFFRAMGAYMFLNT
jgi:hypothetical protein